MKMTKRVKEIESDLMAERYIAEEDWLYLDGLLKDLKTSLELRRRIGFMNQAGNEQSDRHFNDVIEGLDAPVYQVR